MFKDPDKDRDKFRSWLKAIDVVAERLDRPNVLFYFYLVDEPNDWETYDFIRKWGKAIHEAKSVVKVLVTESTKPRNVIWGNLYGAIDIWCPLFPEFDAARRCQAPRTWRDHLGLYSALPEGQDALVAHRLSFAQLPCAGLDRLALSHQRSPLLGRHGPLEGSR